MIVTDTYSYFSCGNGIRTHVIERMKLSWNQTPVHPAMCITLRLQVLTAEL
jgi:hypothetical protein